jgi:hypothetical protein
VGEVQRPTIERAQLEQVQLRPVTPNEPQSAQSPGLTRTVSQPNGAGQPEQVRPVIDESAINQVQLRNTDFSKKQEYDVAEDAARKAQQNWEAAEKELMRSGTLESRKKALEANKKLQEAQLRLRKARSQYEPRSSKIFVYQELSLITYTL